MNADPTMVRTRDGNEVAAYDFGGDGDPLVFVHATGFHAHTWAPVIRHLRDRFHCYAYDVRAHGASPRPANGDFDWRTESRDTLDVVDAFGLAGVKAVGHSMGGAQVLMAEEDFPGSWTSAWTFEPVAHQLPFPLPENPLAAGTRKRRDTFPSRQAAFDNFASKPPFGSFDPEALHAYVDYGFVNNGSEVVLACARDDEADTYNGELVSHVFEGLSSVKIPVQVVGGAISTHFPPDRLQAIAGELPNSTVEMMEGLGHFGPLEAPARVAESIAAALA